MQGAFSSILTTVDNSQQLEMQRRWLSLARSYEFTEQLEFLSAIERNKEAPAQIYGD